MSISRIAAVIYTVLTAFVVAFQLALAVGAPWGSYAMAGAFPGQFPPALRVAALIQGVILVLLAGVVLARSGAALRQWASVSVRLVWVVVVVVALSVVLNLITPSTGERIIWAPVTVVLLICSVLVATSPKPSRAADR